MKLFQNLKLPKKSYKKKKAENEHENNVTEDVIYNKLFIEKTSSQDHDKKPLLQIPLPCHIW